MLWPKQNSLTKGISANARKTRVGSGFPFSGRVQEKAGQMSPEDIEATGCDEAGLGTLSCDGLKPLRDRYREVCLRKPGGRHQPKQAALPLLLAAITEAPE